ncbi:tetratricopeptide repeat protein [Chrysiogenes arsenatis]|uniref:tetratricopeptide repeat protein n=1 Tax=Chrysiogenes arsenatis TaxID=309797 RepID=UPI00135F1BF6|nr:hypothetical protein [Chrysiogenes arsenatis]
MQIGTDRDVFARSLLELARDYKAAGLYDRAKESLQEYLGLIESLEAQVLLLEIHILLTDYEPAIECYKRIAKLSGESFQLEIALFYYLLYQRTKERSHLKAGLKHHQENFFINLEYARELAESPKKGAAYLDIALASPHLVGELIYPLLEDAYGGELGSSFVKDRYQKRLTLFPRESITLEHFAFYLYEIEEQQEAFTLLYEARGAGQTSTAVATTLARLYYRDGDFDKAASLLLECADSDNEYFECTSCGRRYQEHYLLCMECHTIGSVYERFIVPRRK